VTITLASDANQAVGTLLGSYDSSYAYPGAHRNRSAGHHSAMTPPIASRASPRSRGARRRLSVPAWPARPHRLRAQGQPLAAPWRRGRWRSAPPIPPGRRGPRLGFSWARRWGL